MAKIYLNPKRALTSLLLLCASLVAAQAVPGPDRTAVLKVYRLL